MKNRSTRYFFHTLMNLLSRKQHKRYSRPMIQISHHLNYPLHHLQDALFPLFEKNYTNESLRVTIGSANHIWCAYENNKCIGYVLMTDKGSYGGLYIILLGVRQLEQGRGLAHVY